MPQLDYKVFRQPGPSKLSFFLQRQLLGKSTKLIVLFVGLPAGAALVASLLVSSEPASGRIASWADQASGWIKGNPKFAVDNVEIRGATDRVSEQIGKIVTGRMSGSFLDLDVALMKKWVESVPAVEQATVTLRDSGVLEISVRERVPAILYFADGKYQLLDSEGLRLGAASSRNEYLNLKLIAGQGAEEAVNEALELFGVSGKLNSMVKVLVRIGNRRWDLHLDRGRTIKLPEDDPADALRRLTVLDESGSILSREVDILDLRIPGRTIVRLVDTAPTES